MVKDDRGRILLQKRADSLIPEADGKWEFPGRRIDLGESVEDAARRECMEEVGLEIDIVKLLPMAQTRVWDRMDGKKMHVVVLCFLARFVKGEPRPLDKKVSDVRWYAREEIAEIDTLPGIKEFIRLL